MNVIFDDRRTGKVTFLLILRCSRRAEMELMVSIRIYKSLKIYLRSSVTFRPPGNVEGMLLYFCNPRGSR